MNFIIESEMRVGSRWIHYLLKDLYGMKPSPEVEGRRILIHNEEENKRIRNLFEERRIPKIHHMHVDDLFYAILPNDYKVLTIVRNPRDRAVSVAFHHKNDPGKANWPQRGMEDAEAVRYTVMEYDNYNVSNVRMLSNMKYRTSSHTKQYNKRKLLHMWIPYEWLLENPIREIEVIDEFLGIPKVMTIKEAVDKHSFEKRTNRKQGEEIRTDVWRRKGVVKDWENWFTPEMLDRTRTFYELYYQKLRLEEIDP